MNQLNLLNCETKTYYGGSLVKGVRKSKRPLSRKQSIHLVLKAHKGLNLFKESQYIDDKIHQYSKKFGIIVYSHSVQEDHIHLQIRIHDHSGYKSFIRSLTGVLARKYGKGIWNVLPFTRLVQWGSDYQGVNDYIKQNELEVRGVVPYKKRDKNRYI